MKTIKCKVLAGGKGKPVNPWPERLSYSLTEFENAFSGNEAVKLLKLHRHSELPETEITKIATYELEADCPHYGACSNCSGVSCCLIYLPNPEWQEFEDNNPILDLTSPCEEGQIVECEVVDQFYDSYNGRNKWLTVTENYTIKWANIHGLKTRKAYQPIPTKDPSHPLQNHIAGGLTEREKGRLQPAISGTVHDTPEWKAGIKFLKDCMVTDEDERFLRFYDFQAGYDKGYTACSEDVVKVLCNQRADIQYMVNNCKDLELRKTYRYALKVIDTILTTLKKQTDGTK